MIKTNFNLQLVFLCVFGLFFGETTSVFAQSKAHKLSKYAIIDPTYNSKTETPKSTVNETSSSWIYGATELECWRLKVLQQRKDSAKLRVGYPGVFHLPYPEGSFRLLLEKPVTLKSIRFRAVGEGKIIINNKPAGSFAASNDFHTISVDEITEITRIQFDLKTEGEPIALLIDSKELSTSLKNWEWKSKDGDWEPAYHFPQNNQNVPPHKSEDPVMLLQPETVTNNLYDFGRELLGYITVQSQEKPLIRAGESEKEALDVDNTIDEQSFEMEELSNGTWQTKSPLAFRYLYVEDKLKEDIHCKAVFHPVAYKGAFACSDSLLTEIWMKSAYTLRLCMHDFLLDGIKRDRLPWTGDMAMSLLVNAYSFSDPELARRSLVALGRAGIKEQNINGIIDYSLWWIISQDQYQLYFDDAEHLDREWSRMKETLNELSKRCDSDGFLMKKENDWLFIDWVDQEKWTALQVLWWWAQKSGVKLAERVGDKETASYWSGKSEALKQKLNQMIWSEKKQLWLSKNDTAAEITRHPNFLSVVSGLADQNQYPGIKALLQDDSVKPVGTPYMAGYEMIALSQLGDVNYMLNHVKDYWGGMIKQGATTFWEAYNANDFFAEQYMFYTRPYGKSLCHAWSSGPAAFLPSGLFGLKPLEDGWKKFTIDPNPGNLKWTSVCLPTKYGNIEVDIENEDIQISIPAGTTLQWKGEVFEGPQKLKEKL